MVSTNIDLTSSLYKRLIPLPMDSVKMLDGFWLDLQKTVAEVTLPTQYELLESTGRLDNFRRIVTGEGTPFQGYYFNDSDVYKWLEAASWSQVYRKDETIQGLVDVVIYLITSAQDADGYIDSYFNDRNKSQRWKNLRDMHELYCAGHLIQAAVAHARVTGLNNLLDSAIKLADHICDRFLSRDIQAVPGHPEIEMALVELYRTTGEARYLQMAMSFLDQRGYGTIGGLDYHLDRIPFRELERLEGHAVRALYLCCGASDIYLESGDESLWNALTRLWNRMVSRQLYVSGGVGSRHAGEAFGEDFELPNARAYAETCAAIASFMWSWRMLQVSADVKYADLMEWTIYNAILPGIGLQGYTYNYVNPLESNGAHKRQPWFDCACCPTNIVRLLASITGYFYSYSVNDIWIHQYATNISEFYLSDGLEIKLSIKTEYPWDGHVEIVVLSTDVQTNAELEAGLDIPQIFGLNLRIPGWLKEDIPVFINGDVWHEAGKPGTYLNINREWMIGDKIVFDFPMPVCYLDSHPYLLENTNRIAISRGPLLYCAEENDNPNINPQDIFLSLENEPSQLTLTGLSKNIIGFGINTAYQNISEDWAHRLYQYGDKRTICTSIMACNLIILPYFVWGNRKNGWMQVWFRKNMDF